MGKSRLNKKERKTLRLLYVQSEKNNRVFKDSELKKGQIKDRKQV